MPIRQYHKSNADILQILVREAKPSSSASIPKTRLFHLQYLKQIFFLNTSFYTLMQRLFNNSCNNTPEIYLMIQI